ncbi:MAG: hypothetical protein HYR89_12085 [Actinobacteria bacterium]|nr:hypothetical protein [Actinomycetota bacterium]
MVDTGRGSGVGEGVPGHLPGSGAGLDVGDELVGDGGEQVVGVHGDPPMCVGAASPRRVRCLAAAPAGLSTDRREARPRAGRAA